MLRAVTAPLLFYFRASPIKLFRPPRMSSWTVLRALAEAERKQLDWHYMRMLIKKEGV
jgi:hypothetical protein